MVNFRALTWATEMYSEPSRWTKNAISCGLKEGTRLTVVLNPQEPLFFFTALSGFALLDQGYVADLLQSRFVLLALNNTLNSKDNAFFHDTDTMDTLPI